MKKDIHPQWYPEATVTCACGNTFTAGATQQKMEVEICSACHPFYTGQEKMVDTMGRVEKFEQRRKKSEELQKERQKTRQQDKENDKEESAESGEEQVLREGM